MRVAVFETEEWEHEACLRLEPRHAVQCVREPLDRRTVTGFSEAEIISPFVHSRVDAAVLAELPHVGMIATRSTGYDHIDLDWCRDHGIVVCNVPDYGDSTVAEHAFALLLSVSRKIVDAVDRTRHGNFSHSGLRGFELKGHTIGVVGTGRIGRRVIEIARGFGMKVLAYDLRPDQAVADRLGFEYAHLDEVLRQADVLTLHIPASPGAEALLSDREFSLMRQGAILINTARGNVVDIPALVRALADGKLGAAGLDVLPEEPLIREEAEIFRTDGPSQERNLRALVANHVLLRFPNVIVTPHNAYNTESAVHRIIETTIRNIEAFAAGEQMNVVRND
ncbi:hydroxyacid dehydrogenase [Lutibaculum baratangense]|uniref:D-lactate dehydrogenase n=1 Tax=Lutibaculum baratangense AMV1 TaxID=631454 RepID=V4RWQ8_9HYPH|nr:hydroxyacid dehydrogenase [Lutibaculum baratangense]ESR27440.1 D-lactate dehydrogenase [Lutibaculum baratangense AMV1]